MHVQQRMNASTVDIQRALIYLLLFINITVTIILLCLIQKYLFQGPFFAMHTFNQEPTKNYISDFLLNHLALQLSSPRCLMPEHP